MFRYFEQLSSRIAAPFVAGTSRDSKVWECRCGQSLFFRNSQCLACQALLGYQPQQSRLASLQPGPVEGTWLQDGNLDAGVHTADLAPALPKVSFPCMDVTD